MKYYIIAGEASGDLHGSNLIKQLHEQDAKADVRCWGGDLMQDAGATLVKHYRDLAFMGFVEVILNLRTILRNISVCKADIESFEPDVLVLIDYPGFNMRMAKWAKEKGMKVIYYISPQIWAWKQNRGHALKRDCDRMLVILPFEERFYKDKFNWDVDFVGHPLIDAISQRDDVTKLDGIPNDKPIVALLPGSRTQEINTMLPIMLKAAKSFPNYRFVIAGAPSREAAFYRPFLNDNVHLVQGKTYDLLQLAHAALVTSGTATLETALFKVPEVVCYKGHAVSYQIAKRLVRDIHYISLVNLVMDKETVKELIQSELTVKNLKTELGQILEGGQRVKMKKEYDVLQEKLGGSGASAKAARIIIEEAG